jgi:hypothetical protein
MEPADDEPEPVHELPLEEQMRIIQLLLDEQVAIGKLVTFIDPKDGQRTYTSPEQRQNKLEQN